MKQTTLTNLFTPKQLRVIEQEINNPNWTLMINYGAVRSGKTFVDNFVFLFELRHAAQIASSQGVAHPQYILAGVSSKTIDSNILIELFNTFGLKFKFDRHNSFEVQFDNLPAVRVVQAYTRSVAGIAGIRGITAYGAYINEASLANEGVFSEIKTRCSGYPGARVVCDTNPDVPTHWLKTKYIDNAKKTNDIIVNHFVLDDNASNLGSRYVDSLKATTPPGMFYDRTILGLWVAGEGLVYQEYNSKDNTITAADWKTIQAEHTLNYYCGVDWGFEHQGVIVLLADDENGNTYLVDEWVAQHQQVAYWLRIAQDIQGKYGYQLPFYCDSARVDNVTYFQDNCINAINAYKNRLAGVEEVYGAIHNHQFKTIKGHNHEFEREIYQYVWDEKTGEPIKEDNQDDVMDAVRYSYATRRWYLRDQQNNQQSQKEKQSTKLLQQHGVIPNRPFGNQRMGV